jgi:ectoine hydroxylase-related dioxygenase (phytanoyl-CoA dioxygenase family)
VKRSGDLVIHGKPGQVGTSGDPATGWQRAVEEQGFAVVPGVFSAGEIIALLVSLTDLTRRSHRAGVRHVLSHPTINTIAHDRRLIEIAQSVLGSTAVPFRATFFDKSPGSNWLIAWHQDTALPLREKRETPGWGPWSVKEGVAYAHAPAKALEQVLALRIYLDDSTQENGPLRALSGTHQMGVLTDDEVARLGKERSSFECLVAKGDVLAMRPLIVHASSKSQSQEPRRVLHIEYATRLEIDGGLKLATT